LRKSARTHSSGTRLSYTLRFGEFPRPSLSRQYVDSNDIIDYITWQIPQETDVMPVLTIRNVPEEVRSRLRLRAAKAGRSAEAEARAILAAACLSDEKVRPLAELQTWVDQLYQGKKPRGVVDSFLRERRREAKRE